MPGPRTTRRGFLKALGIGAAALAGPRRAAAATAAKKPNIILFLTDDRGWTDTSVRMMAGRADSRSDFYRNSIETGDSQLFPRCEKKQVTVPIYCANNLLRR